MKRCSLAFSTLLLFLLLFLPISGALAWRDASEKDELTGKKIPLQAERAKTPIRQFGRDVPVDLYLKCISASRDGSDAFPVAFLWFSESIGIGEIFGRVLIDDRQPPISHTYPINDRGRSIILASLTDSLRRSSKLKAQFDFPWAGRPVLEFNTTGAAKAFAALPCANP